MAWDQFICFHSGFSEKCAHVIDAFSKSCFSLLHTKSFEADYHLEVSRLEKTGSSSPEMGILWTYRNFWTPAPIIHDNWKCWLGLRVVVWQQPEAHKFSIPGLDWPAFPYLETSRCFGVQLTSAPADVVQNTWRVQDWEWLGATFDWSSGGSIL